MTCIVILELTTKMGTGKQMIETLRTVLPDTRDKDGCESLEVTVNHDNTDNFLLVGRWTTRKHHETYLAWRKQRGDLDEFGALLEGPLSIRYFDLTSV